MRDHLRWELDALRPERKRTAAAGSPEATEVMLMVDGASAASGAEVLARIGGQDVVHRVLVTTDGEVMHVVRVLVPDHTEGRRLCEQVTASLDVRTWTMPT